MYKYRNIDSYGSEAKSSDLYQGSMRIRFAIADVSASDTNTDRRESSGSSVEMNQQSGGSSSQAENVFNSNVN